MKKLLLVPLFLALSWLGTCSFGVLHTPTPSDVIKQAHDAFPSVPAIPFPNPVTPNGIPSRGNIAPHEHRPVHRKAVVPRVPVARPQADQAPVETVPPQQGPVCIFPLNFVPKCTPQPAGRMP